MNQLEASYEEQAALLKALAHPLRLRIVCGLLKCGCRNVSCMERNTGSSQSCISQHLARLKAAGVVKAMRTGNEVYYEIADPRIGALVEALMGESGWGPQPEAPEELTGGTSDKI